MVTVVPTFGLLCHFKSPIVSVLLTEPGTGKAVVIAKGADGWVVAYISSHGLVPGPNTACVPKELVEKTS